MFSENIWQRLSSLIHLTWQNLAVLPLPCSVSKNPLRKKKKKCQHTWQGLITRKVETSLRCQGSVVVFSCRVIVFTPEPQVTLIAGSFALFNVSLTVHTQGYWDQRPVNICCSNTGQNGCRLHWLHTASFASLQSRKMTQPWLQKVTRMIAPVDLNQTFTHNYLSKGCMRHVGNVLRNKWYFLVMLRRH